MREVDTNLLREIRDALLGNPGDPVAGVSTLGNTVYTVSTTVVSLSVPAGANGAEIQNIGGPINYTRFGTPGPGTDPSTTIGLLLGGTSPGVTGVNTTLSLRDHTSLVNFRAIRIGANDGKLVIEWRA
jgi:hypothetical protein